MTSDCCLPWFPFLKLSKHTELVGTSDDDECWICLGKKNVEGDPLEIYCKCIQRCVHKTCLETWQFTNLGKDEEVRCRFCRAEYKSHWNDKTYNKHIQTYLDRIEPDVTVLYQGMMKKVKLTSRGLEAYIRVVAQMRRAGPNRRPRKGGDGIMRFYLAGSSSPICLPSQVTGKDMDMVLLLAKLAWMRERNLKR